MKGKPHYIEADLREGWMLAGLFRLERYLKKHALFSEYLNRR
jgi:hypothetical protein